MQVGVMLKQFLPQLQTTFLKALNDANRQVRLKAAAALGHLIVIHTRADPLFSELHTGVKSSEDPAIRWVSSITCLADYVSKIESVDSLTAGS